MQELYEYLDSIGLTTLDEIYHKVTSQWNNKDREGFVNYLFTLVEVGVPKKNSLFNFIANSTLSGSPYPCEDIRCRINNLDKLSRFAAMYSDTVFIPSPFDKYMDGDGPINEVELFFDISMLINLRPLIENKIIQFTSEYICVCQDCLEKASNEKNKLEEKNAIVNEILVEEYLYNNKFSINYEGKKPYVLIEGPEKYGFHGSMVMNFRKYIPKEIKEIAIKGKTIELPHNEVVKIGVLDSMIQPIIEDLYQQNSIINKYNSTYLTHRDIDIDILNALHNKNDFEKSNKLVNGLSHLIPILNEIDLAKLVELRKKDGESFMVYRDSITNILNDNKDYSVNELKNLFRDKINPELNKIQLTINRNKKNLTGSIAKDLLFTSSIVSIGLYSGILPQDAGKIIAAVGGVKFTYDFYNKIGKLFESDDEVKKNSFYFLWKLQDSINI